MAVGCPASPTPEVGLAPSLSTTTLGIKWTSYGGWGATRGGTGMRSKEREGS